jgi:hypothetical protein
MNDDFEDLLKRWLRERAGSDRSVLQALAGNVAAFPPRRRRQPSQLAAAAAVILALGLAAFALAPRFNSGTGEASPAPPDPAAFAGDPRLARCGATVDTAIAAFEMSHARDYRLHLPAMLLAPELDVEAPAFVVVYRGMSPIPRLGGAPPPGQTWQPRSLEPGRHDVCVLVGTDLATAEMSVYSDVDTSGLTVDVASIGPSDSTEPSGLEATPATVSPPVTPEPAPSWAADITGQLECDGSPQAIGGEIGELTPVGSEGTASPYPWLYAEDLLDLPLEGWTEEPKVPWETGGSNFVRYANVVNGRLKAVLIMGGHSVDGGVGHWEIVGFRACPPNEYDPLRGRTTDDAPWVDANGLPTTAVRTVVGNAHCGWESTVWLFLDGDKRLYLRDPLGVLRKVSVGRYLATTKLPGDAVATGLRSRDRELFTTPNKDFVYIRTPAGVERWPRSSDLFLGCA